MKQKSSPLSVAEEFYIQKNPDNLSPEELSKTLNRNVVQIKEAMKLLNTTQEKNLCLSGGFFLNCVSNYNLLKNLPEDINIYVEPMCNDAGNSLGAAKYFYHFLTKDNTKRPQKNIYYGPSYSYTKNDILNEINDDLPF